MAVPRAPVTAVVRLEFMFVAQCRDGSEDPPDHVLGAASRYLQFVVHIDPVALS